MTEIASKIESIRNMTADLHSIKLTSQKNTEKMFQNLADFRKRILHQMSQIEHTYRSGRIRKRNKRKDDTDSDSNDAKRIDFILQEIKNVQEMSKEMLIELQDYNSQPMTNASDNSFTIDANNKENLSSTDTLLLPSTAEQVNILYSKKLPHNILLPIPPESSESSRNVDDIQSVSSAPECQVIDGTKIENENDAMTRDKIDRLTKKLKDIQTQNDELRNVNENIQNLLMKLNDLKYVDPDTVDKQQAVTANSNSSQSIYNSPQIDSETILKNEKYQNFVRSVKVTSKWRCPSRSLAPKMFVLTFQTEHGVIC